MFAILGGAVALAAGSLVLGRCLLRWLGLDVATATASGLAVAVILADATFHLGGDGLAAAIVVGTAVGIALICEVAAGFAPLRPSVLVGGCVAGTIAIVIGILPFLSNGRPGTLGVSILNDLAIHEYWAWARDSGHVYPGLIFPGYPLGAHSLVGALSTLTATNVERGFAALLVGTPCLTALTAFGAFSHVRLWARALGSGLAAFSYLGAAFLGEGAFKEPMVLLEVLGVALTLRSLSVNRSRPIRHCAVLGVLTAGCVLIEGGPGIAWPGLTIILWGIYEILPRRHGLRSVLRDGVRPVVVGALVLIVSVAPALAALLRFSPDLQGSNLPGYLPFPETMAIWFETDFRLAHSQVFSSLVLAVIGVALLIYAIWWWTRRHDVALPAATVAALIVSEYVHHRSNAYLTGKTQMVFAGLYLVTVIGPLLDFVPSRETLRRAVRASAPRGPLVGGTVGLVILAAFVVGAGRSDSLTLRNAGVDSDARSQELASIRTIVRGQPTIMLVAADFGPWELRGARQGMVVAYGVADQEPVGLDPNIPPPTSGGQAGFSSLTPASLDEYRYAVTTNSAYAASPPFAPIRAAVQP